jgi:hypothetical protein
MSITGHKTESIYQRYDIVSQQDMSTAREKMNRFFESQKAPVVTSLVTTKERSKLKLVENIGVGGGNRTLGHRNHNPALYQAELHPP